MKEELLLSNQICFLVYRLDREIQASYRPLLDTLGLTYPQYLVMLVLWELGQAEVGKLCSLLNLDTGTISPLLKRLEKSGLIHRTRSAQDERVVVVSLTDAGKALEEQALSVPQHMFSCLFHNAEEYVALKQLLTSYIERLSS
jgi:DNA-binding MarR family transcriptional regulator